MTSLLLSSVVALKCRAHFIAEHICASQQNSLDPDCWDLCNLVGFGPRAAVLSQRAECACTALMGLAQSFAHPYRHIRTFSNQGFTYGSSLKCLTSRYSHLRYNDCASLADWFSCSMRVPTQNTIYTVS